MPEIAVTPDTLEFTYTENNQDTVKTMAVHNEGGDSLEVTDITKNESWIVSIYPTAFTVAPNDSQIVTVTVTRDQLGNGNYYDSLSIFTNDPDENPYLESVKFTIDSLAPPVPAYITQVVKSGNSAVFQWHQVQADTLGNPEIVDYYTIYRDTLPEFIPDSSNTIAYIDYSETTYTDTCVLDSAESYYYLVKAVDRVANMSKKSNMGYVFRKFVNENVGATDKNLTSVPYISEYSVAEDISTDLSPSGDPLVKITKKLDSQHHQSWMYTTVPFPRWTGKNFDVVPGQAYEMVTIKDDTVILVGANNPDGMVFLNENPDATDKNWLSIPYNALYTTVSHITDEYSPDGDPLSKITNMRDDQLYENWTHTTVPFSRWTGADFAIEDGRGYDFVTIKDTTWNPAEYTNELPSTFLARVEPKALDIKMQVGTLTEPDRAQLWFTSDGNYSSAAIKDEYDFREAGISHLVRGYFELKACEDVMFTVYRPDRLQDVLTENMVGSGFAMDDKYCLFWFDVGNFNKPWQANEDVTFVIGVSQNGAWYLTDINFKLDRNVDIQELGELSIVPTSQGPQTATDEPLPLTFKFDIAPNPFVRETRVDYALPKKAAVDLIIYDVSGRMVKALTSEMHKPGYYSTVWNGTDYQGSEVSSGIYFIKFKAEDYIETEKLLLLR